VTSMIRERDHEAMTAQRRRARLGTDDELKRSSPRCHECDIYATRLSKPASLITTRPTVASITLDAAITAQTKGIVPELPHHAAVTG
jgi:hypothetical protein